MSKKLLTLSIVIPAYNEERYLSACLDSITAQTQKPDQVIVVNNNSTDKTVKVASSYSFVTVMHEPKQHQAFAQKTGFDHTKGDIIGRIDADSVLPRDWVARVKQSFESDAELVALTGRGVPYDVFSQHFGSAVFIFYNWISSSLAGFRLLWGANCAMRRMAWQKISGQVLQRGDIWEDYDMAFCLHEYGKICLMKDLKVGTSYRAVHKPFTLQLRYQFRAPRTFYFHIGFWRALAMGLLWATMIPIFAAVLVDEYILKPLARRFWRRRFTGQEYLRLLG